MKEFSHTQGKQMQLESKDVIYGIKGFPYFTSQIGTGVSLSFPYVWSSIILS